MMMRVLVTGGTGFVGAHIVAALLDAGDAVTVLARKPGARTDPRARVVRGDLAFETVREAAKGHDVVIHNAVVWRDADDEFGIDDVRAAANVFRGAGEAGVGHVIYTSSTAVHKPYAARMDETMRIAPPDFYGAAKAANESFLLAFAANKQLRCNVVRPGPVIGGPALPGGRVVVYRFIDDIVKAARSNEDIRVTRGEGRQLVAAADLAQVYVRVVHSNASSRQTWLAVARETITWEDVARRAVALSGSRSRIVLHDAADAGSFTFDTSKLERDFGLVFSARETLDADLRRIAAHG